LRKTAAFLAQAAESPQPESGQVEKRVARAASLFLDASRMRFYIHTQADLDAAIGRLVAIDPRWRAALALGGRPPVRRRADGFAGLASVVVSQQLSTASARAIWERLAGAIIPFEHGVFLRARTARLARLGLSGAKI